MLRADPASRAAPPLRLISTDPAGEAPRDPPAGPLADLARSFQWRSSALGPVEGWPEVLRATADLVLRAPTAMAVLWGPDGVMICNDAFREISGRRQADLLGAPFGDAWPAMADLHRQALALALRGEPFSAHNHHIVRRPPAAAEDMWLNLECSPIFDGPRGPRGMLAVVIEQTAHVNSVVELNRLNDLLQARVAERNEALASAVDTLQGEITERQAAEDALRQSQKMEAVGQLAGGIAHDFNNVLTGILGSLELMQRRLAQGRIHDAERFAGVATASANRAAALTHRLLAFARRDPVNPRVVEAGGVVTSVEDLLRRTIPETISLELDLSEAPCRVQCDPNQLESAILNLAINARDAMPDGGRMLITTGETSIDVAAGEPWDIPPGRYVYVSVCDDGCGMSPEVIGHICEPFFTTKPVGVGTGLGFPMVHGFARQSGGGVMIDSEPEAGTTVTILLPLHLGETPEAAADLARRAGGRTGEGKTVLVVEDDQSVRALVMELLQDEGYRGMSATDGVAGLAILGSGIQVDLLIADIGLPGMNGRQLAEAARASRPDLKILFMTAHAPDAAAGPAPRDEPAGMIGKPFTLDGLVERIQDCLGSASGRRLAGESRDA
jgi:signal transduction histidine kinase